MNNLTPRQTPLQAAKKAAKNEFASYLIRTRCTAVSVVPDSVIKAAKEAYEEAGGVKAVIVTGHGNTTHPVCYVTVKESR